MEGIKNFNTVSFQQRTGESFDEFLKRIGKKPAGYKPIEKPIKKKTVRNRLVNHNKNIVKKNYDESTILFIKSFYDQFDDLIEKYNDSTVKIFLLSLIAHLNNNTVSRKRLYDFISEFDTSEKIRQLTWRTFKQSEDRKYENWHHVGAAFSYIMSSSFIMTDSDEFNDNVDTRTVEGIIYNAPNSFLKCVTDVMTNFTKNQEIVLDYKFTEKELEKEG